MHDMNARAARSAGGSMRAVFRLTAIPAAVLAVMAITAALAAATLVLVLGGAGAATNPGAVGDHPPGGRGDAVRHGPLAAQTAAVTIDLGGTRRRPGTRR
jgi:hypothetical protein